MTRQASSSPHDPVRSECFAVFPSSRISLLCRLDIIRKKILWHNSLFPCTNQNFCRRAPQTSETTEAETFVNIAAPRSWLPVPRIHQLPTPSTSNASLNGRSLEQRTTKLFKITVGLSSFSVPSGPKVDILACEAILFVLKFPFQRCWINTQTIYFSLRPLSADAYEAGKRQEETVTRLEERYFLCTSLYGILKCVDSSSTGRIFPELQQKQQNCQRHNGPEGCVHIKSSYTNLDQTIPEFW